MGLRSAGASAKTLIEPGAPRLRHASGIQSDLIVVRLTPVTLLGSILPSPLLNASEPEYSANGALGKGMARLRILIRVVAPTRRGR